MDTNKISALEQFVANGESGYFRLGGGALEVQGRVYGAGAVAATVLLRVTNTPDDANSWIDAGTLALAGNPSATGSKKLASSLAYGKLVVSGLIGTLNASVGSASGGSNGVQDVNIVGAGPVTLEVNEADLTNLGAKADAAATTDTGVFSLIALMKRGLQNWTTLLAAVVAGITVKSGAGGNFTASVAAAGSLSAAVDLGNQRIGRFGMPADIGTSTQLGFQTSHDGATFKDLYDGYGARYKVAVAAGRSIVPDLTMFAAARYVKVVFLDASGVASVYATQRDVNVATLA